MDREEEEIYRHPTSGQRWTDEFFVSIERKRPLQAPERITDSVRGWVNGGISHTS
jgi:hypothetical protein